MWLITQMAIRFTLLSGAKKQMMHGPTMVMRNTGSR